VEAYSPMRKRGVANIISSSRVTATGSEGTCRRFTASRLCLINPTLTRGAICFHRFAVIKASFSMLYFGLLQLSLLVNDLSGLETTDSSSKVSSSFSENICHNSHDLKKNSDQHPIARTGIEPATQGFSVPARYLPILILAYL